VRERVSKPSFSNAEDLRGGGKPKLRGEKRRVLLYREPSAKGFKKLGHLSTKGRRQDGLNTNNRTAAGRKGKSHQELRTEGCHLFKAWVFFHLQNTGRGGSALWAHDCSSKGGRGEFLRERRPP